MLTYLFFIVEVTNLAELTHAKEIAADHWLAYKMESTYYEV